ncbi:MAG: TetR/AcrR family transcriptional regulator [Candidatus Kapaibacterium sp.]
MEEKIINTENRIKEAARKVFMKKGFKGTTSRDIAKEAGLNVALTNYYFRKKEKLFKIIFLDVAHDFLDDIVSILNKPIDLSKKIRMIMESELEVQQKDPDLFIFFYSESRNNPENLLKELGMIKDRFLEKWNEQIRENIEKKIIRKIDPISALSIVIGQMQFPMVASRLLMEIGGFTEKSYKKFLEQEKERAIEMVSNFLFLKNK